MTAPPVDACCASFPPEALPLLAPLRDRPELRVSRVGERVWLFWPAHDDLVRYRVLSIRDAVLYQRSGGLWFRTGHHLPAPEVPAEEGSRSLSAGLFPALIETGRPASFRATRAILTVVRDSAPRPATALRVPIGALTAWAERATTYQLESLQAACQGETVLLRGPLLPPLVGGERLWGERVLIPLGYRADPNLPPALLADALDLAEGDTALLLVVGHSVIPHSAFGPVTRAGIRLAGRGGA